MRGITMIGVPKAVIAEAGASVGDTLTIVVQNDDAPREVEIPPELATVLRREPAAERYFESLSYTHRREHAAYVAEAKKPETRVRRAERTLVTLREQAGEEG